MAECMASHVAEASIGRRENVVSDEARRASLGVADAVRPAALAYIAEGHSYSGPTQQRGRSQSSVGPYLQTPPPTHPPSCTSRRLMRMGC